MFNFKKPNQQIKLNDAEKAELCPFHLDEVSNQVVVDTGAFANVKKGLWKGHEVVVKIITYKSDTAFSRIIKEATIIKRCEHPNIIQLLGICSNEPAIMLPFMEFSIDPDDPMVSNSLGKFLRHCGAEALTFDGLFSHLPMTVARQLVRGIGHMY